MEAVQLEYPFRGRWLVQNSPADRVPSHGTPAFASSYAIDFVPVDSGGRSARFGVASLLVPEPPEIFVGFGRPVLAPVGGVVVGVRDADPDHRAHRGLPSIGYAVTQVRRAAGGMNALAGNHVLLRTAGSQVVALCHLRRGSVAVRVGDVVAVGDVVGECGNSGNSTEPHLHVQVMDSADADSALALPLTFPRGLPRNGEVVDAG